MSSMSRGTRRAHPNALRGKPRPRNGVHWQKLEAEIWRRDKVDLKKPAGARWPRITYRQG